MPVDATEQNFAEEVDTDGAVLVDFWAEWCGPCRMLGPTLEKIEAEHGLKVVKVNVDKESQLAVDYRVLSIPTMILFKDGKVAKTIVGVKPKLQLEKELDL